MLPLIKLHPLNPEVRRLRQISDDLKSGSVFIFPTDTVYAIVADSYSKKGVESLYELKHLPKNKPLSLLCYDISMASLYIEHLPNSAYRIMKRFIPGPYTFVFRANKNLPKPSVLHQKNRQIGIRFPNHIFLQTLLSIHGNPLTSTSASLEDEFIIEPELLETTYGKHVEGIIDGGIVKAEPSTILEWEGDFFITRRVGKGFEAIQAEVRSEI